MNTPTMLTTTDAAALAGVAVSTIKRWSDQGLLPFSRTAGGHRRFEQRAVEMLVHSQAHPSPQEASALDTWVRCLVAGRRFEAEALLLSARERFGRFCDVADEVGLVLREIGRRWQAGELSIAEEHVASECLGRALTRVSDMMPTPVEAPQCLLACASDDEHTLGLALVELSMRERGWASLWLGRATPAAEIVRVLREGQVRLVALSASEAQLDAAALHALAAEVGEHCKSAGVGLVLGGGGAWPAVPSYGVRLTSLAAFSDYLTHTGAR